METIQAVACVWCSRLECDCDQAEIDTVVFLKKIGRPITAENVVKLMKHHVRVRWADYAGKRYFCKCCGTEQPPDGNELQCFACGYDGWELK